MPYPLRKNIFAVPIAIMVAAFLVEIPELPQLLPDMEMPGAKADDVEDEAQKKPRGRGRPKKGEVVVRQPTKGHWDLQNKSAEDQINAMHRPPLHLMIFRAPFLRVVKDVLQQVWQDARTDTRADFLTLVDLKT